MPRHLHSLTALTLCASVASQESVTRHYDLRDLTTPPPGLASRLEEPRLPLPVGPSLPRGESGFPADEGRYDLQPNGPPRLPPEELAAWLESVCGADAAKFTPTDRGLQVTGHAGVHAQVRSALAVLNGVHQQRIRLSLYLLPPGAAADAGGTLSAEQVDALLAATPPLRGTVATPAADEPWVWSSGRGVRLVHDYDVEVAEKANVADPKLGAYFVGARVSASATPLIDGRVLVRVGLRNVGEPKPGKVRALAGAGLGRLHAPDLAIEEARASAVVAAGGGILVAGDREHATWLLRVQPISTPAAPIAGAVALPMGDLAIAPLGLAQRGDAVVRPGEDDEPEPETAAAPDLREAVETLLGNLEAKAAHVRPFGSHVVLIDEPGVQARLEKALRKEAAALRTFGVEVRVGKVGNDVAVRHLTGQLSEADLAATLPRGGVLATMPRHAFALLAGRETAFVRDLEVEIAAKAIAANPVVDSVESGIHVRGAIRPDPSGELRLHVDVRYSELQLAEPFDLGNPALGDLDLPVTAWTEIAQDLPLRSGEWQIVHVGADPALVEGRSLVIAVRVR
jgi:hypothetical protein